ncbi:MAG TPA: RimK/LysX family protein [Ilumatobacter sp.]|nr:RimK/LysX family protein [Ilumatobacter sp.]
MVRRELNVAGWREWVGLPQLGIDAVKAKLDTGARSSSLHADHVTIFDRDGVTFVRFSVRPWQRSSESEVWGELPLVDERAVRSSTGHVETRPVVLGDIAVVGMLIPAEITLTNRDSMGFRMLIGREALRGRLLVNSGKSYVGGRPSRDVRLKNRGRAT